jgi:hypothetical protein
MNPDGLMENEVVAHLTHAEQMLASGEPSLLAEVVGAAERALELLQLEEPGFEDHSKERWLVASAWMKRGIALVGQRRQELLPEALRSFENAVSSQEKLAKSRNPHCLFDLSGGWIHRGDVLAMMSGEERRAEATRSYENALGVLRQLPFGTNRDFRDRLVSALMNYGGFLSANSPTCRSPDAIRCFEEALVHLQAPAIPVDAKSRRITASACINLALTHLAPHLDGTVAFSQARGLAQTAIELLHQDAQSSHHDSCLELKARYALCRAAGFLLAGEGTPESKVQWMMEASDAVDEGLEIARKRFQDSTREFKDLALELVGFGANLYLLYNSNFFIEYLNENLDCPVMRQHPAFLEILNEALSRARARLCSRAYENASERAHALEMLAELKRLESRVRQ